MSNIQYGNVYGRKSCEETKDNILLAMQIAVKHIHNYGSLCDAEEDGLSMEIKEVHQLCDSLDKTLFFGLREYQEGYWPFVKEFTHKNTIKFLEGLENAYTGLQYGRAWLCLALNENSLESYFRSFQQNPRLVKKHYDEFALLRDAQRVDLILMFLAGLEHVPINLSLDKANWGSGFSFLQSSTDADLEHMLKNGDILLSQVNTLHPSFLDNFVDNKNGVNWDDAVEVTDDCIEKFDCPKCKNSLKEHQKLPNEFNNCNVSVQDLERISKYINMTSNNGISLDRDLEIVRSKVVRRVKKPHCQKNTYDSDSKNEFSEECCEPVNSMVEEEASVKEYRLSKVTSDSGLSLDTNSSSDSEPSESNEELCKKRLSFDVSTFPPAIEVTFSTPSRFPEKCELGKDGDEAHQLGDITDGVEERGIPEGREDPHKDTCVFHQNIDRQPLMPGNDGQENCEEEISIYDVSNECYQSVFGKPSVEKTEIIEDAEDVSTLEPVECSKVSEKMQAAVFSTSTPVKPKIKDPDEEELALALSLQPEDLNLRVSSNMQLYLLVEIFDEPEEQFYKMFYGCFNFPRGCRQFVLVLLTNKCLYTLKPQNNEEMFVKCDVLLYSNIDYVRVYPNYQGFTVVTKNFKQHITIYTGDEELTRSILSNMEVAIRRSLPKSQLPAVCTENSAHDLMLKKFLAGEMKCKVGKVELQYFVLVHWDNHDGSTSPPDTPGGHSLQGFLMYRHKYVKDSDPGPWMPGFFLLKGGFLYCMEEEVKNKPLFFIQLCAPHCKGCRRLHLSTRPYAFEVILSNGDTLQLAAADNFEASAWQHSFLRAVQLAGHFIDTEDNTPRPSCTIVANDQLFIVQEEPLGSYRLLSKANICDILTVSLDPDNPVVVIVEFEIAEAIKCSGEWIIFFESETEKEKFVDMISNRWSHTYKIPLQITSIRDLLLQKKCLEVAEEMAAGKRQLQDLCLDS